MSRTLMGAAAVVALLNFSAPAFAADPSSSELEALKADMARMQQRINQLEQQAAAAATPAVPQPSNPQTITMPSIQLSARC